MPMKQNITTICFRCDFGPKYGLGHLMRCISLAEGFQQFSQIKTICLTNKFDEKFKDLLYSSGMETVTFSDQTFGLEYNLEDYIPSSLNSITLFDNYDVTFEQMLTYKRKYHNLLAIDDLADRKHQCNILLDQNFGRSHQDYKEFVAKSAKLLMGSEYALLRPEFEKYKQYSLNRRKDDKFKKLLINMGGVDPDNITGKVLERLQITKLPKDVEITIVMGKTAPHLANVITSANKLPYKSEVKVDVDNMAELMANADIAIGASGATTWERCCLGLPTIQLITAYNQEFIAQKLNKINAIKLVEIDDVVENLENFQHWMKSTGESASKVTNGSGIKRILDCLV